MFLSPAGGGRSGAGGAGRICRAGARAPGVQVQERSMAGRGARRSRAALRLMVAALLLPGAAGKRVRARVPTGERGSGGRGKRAIGARGGGRRTAAEAAARGSTSVPFNNMAEGPARAESPPPPASEPRGARAPLVPLLTERGASDPKEGRPRCREAPAAVLPGPAATPGFRAAERSSCRRNRRGALSENSPAAAGAAAAVIGLGDLRVLRASRGRWRAAWRQGRAVSSAVELRFSPCLDDGKTLFALSS